MYANKVKALGVATKLNNQIAKLSFMMLDAVMKDDEEYIKHLDDAIKHLKEAVKQIEEGCGIDNQLYGSNKAE